MENTEIIMNEDVMELAEESVVETSGINFGKIGLGILVVGAVAALGYKCYKLVRAKKAKEADAACCEDNAQDGDFVDEESEN